MSELGHFRESDSNRVRSVDPPAADMRLLHRHVGFVPGSDISPPLFDHLVSEQEQGLRNCDAQRLGSLEVDDEIEFGRLLHR